jgi:hypothetical protein
MSGHPFDEMMAELSRRVAKARGSAAKDELAAIQKAKEAVSSIVPFDEIAKLPIEEGAKLSIHTNLVEGISRHGPLKVIVDACTAIKKAGGTVGEKNIRLLELHIAQILANATQITPGLKYDIRSGILDPHENGLKTLGVSYNRIYEWSEKSVDQIKSEISQIINSVHKPVGAATVSAVTSTPSTTVSSASSEGRQWYQWLTHEEEAGKAVFSGKRTAIAAGAAAAVAGGIYLLKRDKGDDSWRSRTSTTDTHSAETAR